MTRNTGHRKGTPGKPGWRRGRLSSPLTLRRTADNVEPITCGSCGSMVLWATLSKAMRRPAGQLWTWLKNIARTSGSSVREIWFQTLPFGRKSAHPRKGAARLEAKGRVRQRRAHGLHRARAEPSRSRRNGPGRRCRRKMAPLPTDRSGRARIYHRTVQVCRRQLGREGPIFRRGPGDVRNRAAAQY
jgi:hypothetical protein